MKIALLSPPIVPVPPPLAGGTERVVSLLCKEYQKAGHEVTLFAPSDSTEDVKLVSPGRSVIARDDPAPSLPGALEAISISQVLDRVDEFDIIHCHTEFSHLAAFQHVRDKVFTTLHWRLDENDRQEAYRYFDEANVIGISKSQLKPFSGSKNAAVIYHGIDANLYTPSLKTNGALSFLGRLTDQKRPDVAIRIAQACKLPLDIAGNRDIGNPEYYEKCVAPHLTNEFRYIGEVDDRGKDELLGSSRCLLFPIDWEEPFGLVMIEAMACGCPMIAWNKGSVPEVIEDGVTGFIVETEGQAISAVGRLHELDRATIRARFEQRFTASRMAKYYLRLFQKHHTSHRQ